MSRYEQRLNKLVQGSGEGIDAWVYRLRLACYHARRGDVAAGRAIIAAARNIFGAGISATAVVHINLSEAVSEYFEHGIEAAMPKFLRARALSIGCSVDDDAPAMVSAWLAGIHRYRADWDRLRQEVVSILGEPARISEDVCCRVGLTLGDSYIEAGCAKRADTWYQFARKWAAEIGDDATIGASIHNRAAFNIFNTRLALIEDSAAQADFGPLRAEAASANNFGSFYKDRAFAWSLQLLEGQVHLLERRYRDAIKLLGVDDYGDGWTAEWPAANLVRSADILLCKSLLGLADADSIERQCDLLRVRQFDLVSPGDRAIASNAISIALDHVGSEEARAFDEIAAEALSEYRVRQRYEMLVLDEVEVQIASGGLRYWVSEGKVV